MVAWGGGVSGRGRWIGLVFAVLAVLTLPVAIVATRWSKPYELLHSALAIPVAAGLALVALSLASTERRASELRLGEEDGSAVVGLTRALAALALCLAASGLVAIAVYGILTYLGEH